jgi:hypothetical protein
MTLLNGMMALGGLAFAVPLAIHLLLRTRLQTVAWGAMQFLEGPAIVNTRRIQWRQWILLLLRCLVPILLALAMARPFLPNWNALQNGAPIAIVIAIDDSLSMMASDVPSSDISTPTAATSTRFAHACRLAQALLASLPDGSDARLLLAGTKPQLLPSQMPKQLITTLESLATNKVPAGALNYRESIAIASTWLTSHDFRDKRLIFFSDFEKSDWSNPSAPETNAITSGTQQHSIASLHCNVGPLSGVPERTIADGATIQREVATGVDPLPIQAIPVRPTHNVFIKSVSHQPMHVCPGTSTTLQIELGFQGERYHETTLSLVTYINSVEVDRRPIAPATQPSLQIPWTPTQVGEHRVRVECLVDDDLKSDNVLSTIMLVSQPVPVLIIYPPGSSDSSPTPDLLRLSLAPFAEGSDQSKNKFAVQTVSTAEWSTGMFRDIQLVLLCGVSELSTEQQHELFQFVSSGKGLIVIPSSRAPIASMQSWQSSRDGGVRIAEIVQRESMASRTFQNNMLDVKKIGIEPLRTLSAVALESIASVSFANRLLFRIDEPENGNVGMQWQDGQAWLLASSLGLGRCIWLGTSLDAGDSNLPSKPAFVPLMQRLCAYASQLDYARTRLEPGDVWSTRVPDNMDSGWIQKPDGSISKVKSEAGGFTFTETRLIGEYLMRGSDDASSVAVTESDEPKASDNRPAESERWERGLAVWNANRESESRLNGLSGQELDQLQASLGYRIERDVTQWEENTSAQPRGREIWTWFWGALLFCLLAESFLAGKTKRMVETSPRKNMLEKAKVAR